MAQPSLTEFVVPVGRPAGATPAKGRADPVVLVLIATTLVVLLVAIYYIWRRHREAERRAEAKAIVNGCIPMIRRLNNIGRRDDLSPGDKLAMMTSVLSDRRTTACARAITSVDPKRLSDLMMEFGGPTACITPRQLNLVQNAAILAPWLAKAGSDLPVCSKKASGENFTDLDPYGSRASEKGIWITNHAGQRP